MLRRMMGIDQIFFCQKNVLDLSARKLEITAWNESFDNRVTVEEKCIYYAEGNRTKFSQSAKLKIHSFWGLESTVEKLMITHYKVYILFYSNYFVLKFSQHLEVAIEHPSVNFEKNRINQTLPLNLILFSLR